MRSLLLAFGILLGLGAGGTEAAERSIMTGKATGTYIRFGQDIARVAEHFGLDLKAEPSAGSLENVEAVLRRPNTPFAIVQSDVLDFIATFADDKDLKRTAAGMRMVFPLYTEEVHLLARPGIGSLMDLQGKRVAVGAPNSGTLLTATLMLASAGVEAEEEVQIDTDEALAALRQQQVDAMFYVAGRPAKLFASDVTAGDGFHLVPITEPAVRQLYQPSVIPARTYPWQEAEVPTVSVRAVLMTYHYNRPTTYQRTACATVGKVARMIADNLDWLRGTGRGHPKWQEVDLAADVVSWESSKCAEAGLEAPEDLVIPVSQKLQPSCDDPNPIRQKLCLVRQQLRQQIPPAASAKLM
jgi:TRAP transporter TAXI family solute receptor